MSEICCKIFELRVISLFFFLRNSLELRLITTTVNTRSRERKREGGRRRERNGIQETTVFGKGVRGEDRAE